MQETWVWSLVWEDPLKKGMATHSSVLAWRIPGTAEPGGLPSMGSHRVRHDWCDLAAVAAEQWEFPVLYSRFSRVIYFIHSTVYMLHWWLRGKEATCKASGKESPCKVGDVRLIPGSGRSPGEGHSYPLQYSCLENPMDRGAWRCNSWASKRVGQDLVTRQLYICLCQCLILMWIFWATHLSKRTAFSVISPSAILFLSEPIFQSTTQILSRLLRLTPFPPTQIYSKSPQKKNWVTRRCNEIHLRRLKWMGSYAFWPADWLSKTLSTAIHDSIPSHLPLPNFLLDSAFDYSTHQVLYGGESFSTHHGAGDFCRNSNACDRHFFYFDWPTINSLISPTLRGLARSIIGEGNGNPLRYSCLETPMDGEACFSLQSVRSQRVRHDWTTSLSFFLFESSN